jgi:peptide-methionine (S)-S-oxide reductase
MRHALTFAAALSLSAASAFAAPAKPGAPAKLETAIVAGGCFWCTEADMEKVPGVTEAVSGYTGGRTQRPTYEQVSAGGSGHYEAVKVTYDPGRITYDQLLRKFWPTIDPTDASGQFCDKGESYRSAVFVRNDAQRRAALATRAEAQRRLGQPVVTPIVAEARFWPAEGYHQDYAKKNPIQYRFYRGGCGRDRRLKALWGEASAAR